MTNGQMRIENSFDYVFVSRVGNFGFVTVDDKASRDYGYSREEFLKMTIFDIEVDPPAPSQMRKIFNAVSVGEIIKVFSINRRKDGSMFPVYVRFVRTGNELALAHVPNMIAKE